MANFSGVSAISLSQTRRLYVAARWLINLANLLFVPVVFLFLGFASTVIISGPAAMWNAALTGFGLPESSLFTQPMLDDFAALSGAGLVRAMLLVLPILIMIAIDYFVTPIRSVLGLFVCAVGAIPGLALIYLVASWFVPGVPSVPWIPLLTLSWIAGDGRELSVAALLPIWAGSANFLLSLIVGIVHVRTGLQSRMRTFNALSARYLLRFISEALGNLIMRAGPSIILKLVLMAGAGALISTVNRFVSLENLFLAIRQFTGPMTAFNQETLAIILTLVWFGVPTLVVNIGLSIGLRNFDWRRALVMAVTILILTPFGISVAFGANGESAFTSIIFAPPVFAAIAVFPLARSIAGDVSYWLSRANLTAIKATQPDDAQSVLYLRQFNSDKFYTRRLFHMVEAALGLGKRDIRVEEVLADSAFRFMPVKALGNPSEGRPELGALRDYLDAEGWRPYVQDAIVRAKTILFLVGNSANTAWETERIADNDAFAKTIFVVPPQVSDGKDYFASHREKFEELGLTETTMSELFDSGLIALHHQSGGWHAVVGAKYSALDYTLALDHVFTQETGPDD